MKKLSIWVHLGNVALELYSKKGLSYITSALGTPLYMDTIIAKQQRSAYAKICVEMRAALEVPRTIDVELRDGSLVSVKMEIPWMPQKCSHCCIFGHSYKTYPSKPMTVATKVWRPKDKAKATLLENKKNEGATKPSKSKKRSEMKKVKVTETISANDKTAARNHFAKANSVNRFAILESIKELDTIRHEISDSERIMDGIILHSPKKHRVTATGMADLMKAIKIWNTRGFNYPLKRKNVVNRIQILNIDLLCLIETRVKQHQMQAILDSNFYGWGMYHNYSKACNGRIWILWRPHRQVDSLIKVLLAICSLKSQKFFLSAIYGSNNGAERKRLWSHLLSLRGIISDSPWILAGDFNVITYPSENLNFNGSQITNSKVKELQDCMTQLALFD
ncbi:uncharacterized protein LOC111284435 [Durio zibethinus]|uniref:Uncharacterized protein LOC111284435 n=1 Tax=Durio zibethinus TaxID=66656 RepID=A0A6P5XL12_DURZI|nr:uncharacterized protein LOC111284435 [Durio zibethinus]